MTDEPKDLSIELVENKAFTTHVAEKSGASPILFAGVFFLALSSVILYLAYPFHHGWIAYLLSFGLLLGFLFGSLTTILSLIISRDLRHLEKNKPTSMWILSEQEVYVHTTGILLKRINKLIGRWNRRSQLVNIRKATPLPNTDEFYEKLVELREETDRRVQTSMVLLEMEKEGDFETQDANSIPLTDMLENMNAIEDVMSRSLGGVVQGLNSPLAKDLNGLALEEELRQELDQTAQGIPEVKKPRGRIATTGS